MSWQRDLGIFVRGFRPTALHIDASLARVARHIKRVLPSVLITPTITRSGKCSAGKTTEGNDCRAEGGLLASRALCQR
jgi:hypothetical protein